MENREEKFRSATKKATAGMVAIIIGAFVFMATFPDGAMLLTVFLIGEIVLSLRGIKRQDFDNFSSPFQFVFIFLYGGFIAWADRIDAVLASSGPNTSVIVFLRWVCAWVIAFGMGGLFPLFKSWNRE